VTNKLRRKLKAFLSIKPPLEGRSQRHEWFQCPRPALPICGAAS
jgi:hypothetical protein